MQVDTELAERCWEIAERLMDSENEKDNIDGTEWTGMAKVLDEISGRYNWGIIDSLRNDGDKDEHKQTMGLGIPPEPVDLKQEMKSWPKREIEQGTWNTTLLWHDYGWKHILKDLGLRWQDFWGLYGNVSIYFVDWVNDKVSWKSAINRLIEEITEYSKEQ